MGEGKGKGAGFTDAMSRRLPSEASVVSGVSAGRHVANLIPLPSASHAPSPALTTDAEAWVQAPNLSLF